MAMEFCVKYDRKNEFRRLSDSLRTHLNQITRNTKGQNAISLTNPGIKTTPKPKTDSQS